MVSSPSSSLTVATSSPKTKLISSPSALAWGVVHLLPSSIKQDGPCLVSHYFKPRKIDAMVDDLCVEEVFFHGRKLEGITIPLLQGYRGYVLDNKRSGNEKCSETTRGGFGWWVSRADFTSLTYWNHDNLPSPNDLLPRCFHWFFVANALHKLVIEEELASATSVQTMT